MWEESTFGALRVVREIAPVEIGYGRSLRRFVGVNDEASTAHLLYCMALGRMGSSRRRFIEAASEGASMAAHVLPIEAFSLDLKRGGVLVTPFVGDAGGLVTLGGLLAAKNGRMPVPEVRRALTHLLEGLESIHRAGLVDGALGIERCLVDTRGRIRLELPGLGWLLARRPGHMGELARQDVRTIAGIGLTLCTGVLAGRDGANPTTIERGVARAPEPLRRWLMLALSPLDGFATPGEALRVLREICEHAPPVKVETPVPPVGVLRGLWGRVFGAGARAADPRRTGT